MISCLTEHGRIGLTAVGDTPAEADRRYRDARADPAGGGAAVAPGGAAAGLRMRRCNGSGTSPTARTWPSERFRCYLSGGRPAGGAREYAGCRDPRDPQRTVSLHVPGRARLRRPVAGVGRRDGVLRRAAPGPGRLPRATSSRPTSSPTSWPRRCVGRPGASSRADLAGVLPDVGSVHTLGPGRYETVVRLGERDGVADVHGHPRRRGEPGARGADARRTCAGSPPGCVRRTAGTPPGSPATSPRRPGPGGSGRRTRSRPWRPRPSAIRARREPRRTLDLS